MGHSDGYLAKLHLLADLQNPKKPQFNTVKPGIRVSSELVSIAEYPVYFALLWTQLA